jgi:hypothetical protein
MLRQGEKGCLWSRGLLSQKKLVSEMAGIENGESFPLYAPTTRLSTPDREFWRSRLSSHSGSSATTYPTALPRQNVRASEFNSVLLLSSSPISHLRFFLVLFFEKWLPIPSGVVVKLHLQRYPSYIPSRTAMSTFPPLSTRCWSTQTRYVRSLFAGTII